MIYEVLYIKENFKEFEKYVKNVYKINYKTDCFIYFHYGEKAKKILNKNYPNNKEAYFYIKDLEKRFKVNINWIDISYIFDHIKFEYDIDDLERVIYYVKQMNKNAIERLIEKWII
jgi:hypothetical protein